ncbi:MAG: hypothetical protein AAFX99_15645 [Myxococcota bacterium]
MLHMKVADIKLGLADLLTNRIEALRLMLMAPVYEKTLRTFQEEFAAVGLDGAPQRRALASELQAADQTYDGFGAAVWHLTEAYRRLPTTDATIDQHIMAIRDTFIPTRSELNKSYADQASRAKERQAKLLLHTEALQAFPVMDGTLEDWVKGQLEAGVSIDVLMTERSKLITPDDSPEVASLRSRFIGKLNRIRATLADELEGRPELPRDLDHRIFGYFDLLSAARNPTPEPPSAPDLGGGEGPSAT